MSTISSASHRLTSARVLLAVAGIYISQTIVTALATQALPSLLRSEGASLTVAGLTALLWVPWGIRFLWAPWIERRRLPLGRPERRSCALVLVGLMLAALGFVWVALYSALMNLTSPLQAGVDFTVFQSADALLAMAGGVAGGWLAEHLGYYFCFGLAAALSIVAAVLVWHHARLEQVVPSSSQGAVHVG